MGLGWVLGFVAAFTDWPALWYIFIVVNSLQGAMLCAAFVLTRQVLRLLADCVRRAGTGTSNDMSQTLKSPTAGSQDHGSGTAVVRMSLPELK